MKTMEDCDLNELKIVLGNELKKYKRVAFLGLGENRLGDDGFGPYFIHKLQTSIDKSSMEHSEGREYKFINGGITPESRIQEIIAFSPDLLILIDAVEANHTSGSIFLLPEETFLPVMPISSHSLPIQLVITLIKKSIENLQVLLLGVEPFILKVSDIYAHFNPDQYTLDDYEEDCDLPFFEFNLSPEIIEISEKMVKMLISIL